MDATVDFRKDGLQVGSLRVPHSVHRSAYGHIPIPVAVLKNGGGPIVMLVGGIHGDEYEGPIALAKFAQRIDPNNISGTVIVLPALNYPAFQAASRVSPIDGINLNRTFPGKSDGTVTEVIADYVTQTLLPIADYVFDVHAGGSSLQYLPAVLSPFLGSDDEGRKMERIVSAMSPERIIYFDGDRAMSGEARVLSNYAKKNGAAYLCGEFGGGSTINPDGLAMVERSIARFLIHIGVLNDEGAQRYIGPFGSIQPLSDMRAYSMDDSGLFLFAEHPGYFEPAFRIGEVMEPGQVAGYLYDSSNLWRIPQTLRFKSGGLAVCIRTFAQVEPGDCLGHLARPL